MDYEKKYKDILAKAREIHRNEAEKRFDMEWLFPELKESEDERIRKALVRFHKSTIDIDGIKGADILAWLEKQGQTFTKKDVDDAYLKGICDAKQELEKQGEQKPTSDTRYEVKAGGSLSVNGKPFDYEKATITQKDFASKQEPKFNVGDYIVSDYCMGRVVEITNDAYLLDTGQGIPFSCHSTRLWDISDAKDGDVLHSSEHKLLWIYKNKEEYHAAINLNYANFVSFGADIVIPSDVHPATKEQRDLLFQKMKEAGYEWADDKKELKKVEQKLADKVEPFDKYEGLTDFERTLADICIGWIDEELGWKQYIKDNADVLLKIAIKKFNSIQDAPFEQKPADKNATTKQDGWLKIPFGAKDSELQEETYFIPNGFHAEIEDDKVIIKKGEKSAAWSDEDENYLQSAENACEYQYGKNTSTILWLKSLKDRIGG